MSDEPGSLGRRGALLGAGAAGLAGLISACADARDDDSAQPGMAAGTLIGRASDIPVGGGKIFDGTRVVVTQPEPGEFRAFSATCTHQYCTVQSISAGTINCPCHGSRYRIDDASVVAGPAKDPLPKMNIVVEGGDIRIA